MPLPQGGRGGVLGAVESCRTDTHQSCASRLFGAAQGAAYLEGLLTIFPTGRKEAEGPQGTPLSESDVASLSDLAKEFEIDFLCLSFTQRATDVQEARTALASMGLAKTQVGCATC